MVFLVTLILAFGLQLFFPWWAIVVLSFAVCGIISKDAKIAFWQPFAAIFILWSAMALYKTIPNGNILADRIAEMFHLKSGYLVLLVGSTLGALTTGISGYCGYHFRLAVLKIKHKN